MSEILIYFFEIISVIICIHNLYFYELYRIHHLWYLKHRFAATDDA